MAAAPNPFLEFDLIEDEIEKELIARADTPEADPISFDSIAAKLLRDNLLLTALELHTELIESGRELPRLRDFFSNPAHFDRMKNEVGLGPSSPSGLPRTSSVQTFDSLDFARYSDDGDRQTDEKVAVLEFELRKAHDTIKSLRSTLTKAAEAELPSPERSDGAETNISGGGEPLRDHERRALNFLINEYLLCNSYKITSVTFAEEENQDFEDWDEVGLNIPKPPDLLHLYRDYGSHVGKPEQVDVTCQVEMTDIVDDVEKMESLVQDLESRIEEYEHRINESHHENAALVEQLRMAEEVAKMSESSSAQFSTTKSASSHNSMEVATDENSSNTQPMPVQDGVSDVTMVTEEMNSHTRYDWIPVQREISEPFRTILSQQAVAVSQENRLAQEVNTITDSSREKVVLMLGRCLPHIVPNVLLAKREELIPLILVTACLHPEPKTRDNLLNILFNLIKRPDHEQRQIILTGCVAFAQHVGPRRVEEEFLPQCWEQISHKYMERRILVSESCGALAPYLPEEIRSSLVLSMLQQMLYDDKESDVRESVVRSLALLMAFISDQQKFSKCLELVLASLDDPSEKVVNIGQQILLPVFALWAIELRCLEVELVAKFVDRLEELIQNAEASQRYTGSTVLPVDEQKFAVVLRHLQELVPFLFASVLLTGPFAGKIAEVDSTPDIDISGLPKLGPLNDLVTVMGDSERLVKLIYLYKNHVTEDEHVTDNEHVIEEWPTYQWISGEFITRLVAITSCLDLSRQKLVTSMARLFNLLCRIFGQTFIDNAIRPKFQKVLTLSEEQYDNCDLAGQTALLSASVPVYASGVLLASAHDPDRKTLISFLKDLLCTVSLCNASLDSLKAAFMELSTSPCNHEVLLTVLWDGVVHSSPQVRHSTAIMFQLLTKCLSESLVANRVVPALVTLASDPEMTVRAATVPAFGTILEYVTQREILDKVYMQLQSFMDDPCYKDQHHILVELIGTFARVGPNAEPRFRDEIIIPRLAALAASNNLSTNERRRSDVANRLLDAYTALHCCFISDQLLMEAMLPGLACLRQDMTHLSPDHEGLVNSMIKEYNSKLETSRGERCDSQNSTTPPHSAPSPTIAASPGDDVRTKMMNRFKDLRDVSHSAKLTNIFKKK